MFVLCSLTSFFACDGADGYAADFGEGYVTLFILRFHNG